MLGRADSGEELGPAVGIVLVLPLGDEEGASTVGSLLVILLGKSVGAKEDSDGRMGSDVGGTLGLLLLKSMIGAELGSALATSLRPSNNTVGASVGAT